MKIYTKTGDKGETSLFSGGRVSKDDLRVEAYGTVDELNSVLGVCRASSAPPEIDSILQHLQNDLFTLGADLATAYVRKAAKGVASKTKRISAPDVVRLENTIDSIEPKLEPLKAFVLPGGSRLAATLHMARSVCRRAERRTITLSKKSKINPDALIYLNRLSDLLFVMARWANAMGGVEETKWSQK